MSYYQQHVFFCNNLRDNGKKCCGEDGVANQLRDYAKKRLKKLGLHQPGAVRTSLSSCLGQCEAGPVIVIYPDNIWYHYESKEDIDEIIEQHIMKHIIVERLVVKN